MRDGNGRNHQTDGKFGPEHRKEADVSLPGKWAVGVEQVQQMVDEGLVQDGIQVVDTHIEAMFDDAARHLDSADLIKEADPNAAYAVMYDAVRKTMVACLARQGLRVRGGEGGHVNVGLVVRAQLGDAAGRLVEPFDRMRRTRNRSEYDLGADIYPEDVADDLPKARAIVEKLRTWSERLGRF